MPNWLIRNSDHTRIAGIIYGSIVASARQPTFYASWGVPDTREGRFEMLALHVALVMHRLGRAGASGATLGRSLGEVFMTDMDDNMREIGISDLKVPQKVKRAAAALYDRHRDYGAALGLATTSTEALKTAISAAFAPALGPAHEVLDSSALAHYMERLYGGLVVTSDADCLVGALPLPWPAL
jgi:cytochrome b pre-mRNA-processing protein 3